MPVDFTKVHQRVRDAIILNLREGFKTDTVFTYIEDVNGNIDPNTKIWINDVTPQDVFGIKIPSIIVESFTANERRYLNDELIEEIRNISTNVVEDEISGTSFDATINVKLLTESTIERDQVLDKMYNFLKLIPDILADNGVAIHLIDFIPESREAVGTRLLYSSGFSMSAYVEWLTTSAVTDTVEGVTTDITFEP